MHSRRSFLDVKCQPMNAEITQIVRSKDRGIEIYEAKINLEEFKLDVIPVL